MKACPFCQCEYIKTIEKQSELSGTPYFFVECPRCMCRGPRSLERERAENLWGERESCSKQLKTDGKDCLKKFKSMLGYFFTR